MIFAANVVNAVVVVFCYFLLSLSPSLVSVLSVLGYSSLPTILLLNALLHMWYFFLVVGYSRFYCFSLSLPLFTSFIYVFSCNFYNNLYVLYGFPFPCLRLFLFFTSSYLFFLFLFLSLDISYSFLLHIRRNCSKINV